MQRLVEKTHGPIERKAHCLTKKAHGPTKQMQGPATQPWEPFF